ncbi:uncharacterized protein P174DRAFT_451725 [Aspergillus novofumigatus IBT 16806]|uniref:Uncharacterized protein n=1 Tax=Aspergillus novofumigatus (strain IBT 16806) TaxID=1392255 RepID=A0A2I1C423_ASPN1|nr:uncharacterized protein P174DRAFT_451725 [Aspergillus novofumigatus IBT 16806]PKX92379.1 hypothetical protein P174DRAFT_451725 [Aspergillus novofumigatus IBT 16806]
MASKKLFRNHALGLIEVALKWLSATSNILKAEVDEIKETFEQVKKVAARDRKLPGVAISDLTLEEVESIFYIKKLTPKNKQPGDKWDLEPYNNVINVQYPDDFLEFFIFLNKALDYLKLAHEGSTKAEVLVRAQLNVILGLVLGFTKQDSRIIPYPVSWGYKTPFWKTVRIRFRERLLRGQPDYALWYGAQANLETNLVIVEAKTREELGKSWGRVNNSYWDIWVRLLYHSESFATDSQTFNFYRINQRSKVS